MINLNSKSKYFEKIKTVSIFSFRLNAGNKLITKVKTAGESINLKLLNQFDLVN